MKRPLGEKKTLVWFLIFLSYLNLNVKLRKHRLKKTALTKSVQSLYIIIHKYQAGLQENARKRSLISDINSLSTQRTFTARLGCSE